ncbi:hypothetical protein BMS3Bbin11_01612 [bacterium BMS3Bbin11]|nr:hypothetical protein BMS3Abin11_01073 [bacterium BMS3Abin11]GBE46511.1 hypothetical protein BMS3Bbin11_01612 [bacterium BMS3Bbin11]GMT40187.1 MAG: hypothetical protein IEMM0001_0922 [bacterium]
MKKIFPCLIMATITALPIRALQNTSTGLQEFSAKRGKNLWTAT